MLDSLCLLGSSPNAQLWRKLSLRCHVLYGLANSELLISVSESDVCITMYLNVCYLYGWCEEKSATFCFSLRPSCKTNKNKYTKADWLIVDWHLTTLITLKNTVQWAIWTILTTIFLIKDSKRLHEELQSFSSLSWCMYSFWKRFYTPEIMQKRKHMNCTSMPMSSHTHSHTLITVSTSTPGHQWLLYGSLAVYRPVTLSHKVL